MAENRVTQAERRRQVDWRLAFGVIAALAIVAALVVGQRGARQRSLPAVVRTPLPLSTADGASTGRRTLWVLAIGVSHYTDPDLQLRFPAADARAVAQAFGRQRGGPLYCDVKTQVLADAEVTRASILRAIDEFLGKAAPIDVGVIYLAGHGVHDELLDNYYFLPAAASPNKPRIEGLDMNDL